MGWVPCPEHGEVEALAIEWPAQDWSAGRRGRWTRALGDCGCVITAAPAAEDGEMAPSAP